MKITKSQLKELIMKEIQESSFMDKVDKEKSSLKAKFDTEFKKSKPDASPEEVEEYAAIAARAVPMVARALATDKAIDKVTGEDDEVEEGKASAIKKGAKKVWDKVGPHVKDIAKQAAAGAIEKGSQAAKDKISKKLGSNQKDEIEELKFGSKAQYSKYKKQHNIKPGTTIDIAGKKSKEKAPLKTSKAREKEADKFAADMNAKMDAAEKMAEKEKNKNISKKDKKTLGKLSKMMKTANEASLNRKVTVKEVKRWFKSLEENRYKKTYNSDARRVSWMVNNNLSEDYDTMPISMKKKWPQAAYKRERWLAKEFIKHLGTNQVNEIKLRESIRNIIKRLI